MPYKPNIHHRRRIRLKSHDYSQAGLYFITICCQGKICRFGKIKNGEMILNDWGGIAQQCWLEIPQHFPDAILHEYVVMPNHVHGIIELTGVGERTAIKMIVETNAFRDFNNARKFCCHAGVAPFKYDSGSSVRS